MSDNTENSDNLKETFEQLQVEKIKLEIEKVRSETTDLKRPWYKRAITLIPAASLFVSVITPIVIFALGYWLLGGKELLDAKRERLSLDQTRLQERVAEYIDDTIRLKASIQKFKADSARIERKVAILLASQTQLEKDKKTLEIHISDLSSDKNKLVAEKAKLQKSNSDLNLQLRGKTFTETLVIIDSLGYDFNPNSKIYTHLKKSLSAIEKNEAYKLVNEYVADNAKTLNCRLSVLTASYKYFADEKFFKTFNRLLNENAEQVFCNAGVFAKISPNLNNTEWNPEEYHTIITSVTKTLLNLNRSLVEYNGFLAFTSTTKKDALCNIVDDPESLLNYLELFRNQILIVYPNKTALKKAAKNFLTMPYSTNALRAVFAACVIKNDSIPSNGMFIELMMGYLPTLKINQKDGFSTDYWKKWASGNQDIYDRMLEPHLKSYRKNFELVQSDLKEQE